MLHEVFTSESASYLAFGSKCSFIRKVWTSRIFTKYQKSSLLLFYNYSLPILHEVNLFEHVLRIRFQPFLSTSSYQFGFKKKSSTSLAIQCLKDTINYYTSNGSNAYCSFLDASKAFDRLVHAGLFLNLIQRRVPMVFLNIIMKSFKSVL